MVLRRMKHTPNLPMAMVFSEACENKLHGYGIYWSPGQTRVIEAPSGQKLELFMSGSDLGWLKVEPITKKSEVRDLLMAQQLGNGSLTVLGMQQAYHRDKPDGSQCAKPPPDKKLLVANGLVSYNDTSRLMVKTTDPTVTRSVGMGASTQLKGVALLRRRHSTDGHPALPITVKNLRAEGAFDKKLLTVKDVEIFAKQGCGTCEITKMRRRAFSIKVQPKDNTVPLPGKLFVFNACSSCAQRLSTPASLTSTSQSTRRPNLPWAVACETTPRLA